MNNFQNEFVVVETVNNSKAIILTWKGFIPSAKYREGLERALEIAKTHNIKNWISDIRYIRIIGVKDQEWVGTEWLVKAVSSGCYKKQAVIMSEDLFGQASANNILTTVQNQAIEVKNFVKVEDAKKWCA